MSPNDKPQTKVTKPSTGGAPLPVDQKQPPAKEGPVVNNSGPSTNDNPTNTPTPRPNSADQDILGIISLVCIIISLQLVGVILGYIGMKKAKREGYSPILSQIGFWVNLGICALAILVIVVCFLIFGLAAMSSSSR